MLYITIWGSFPPPVPFNSFNILFICLLRCRSPPAWSLQMRQSNPMVNPSGHAEHITCTRVELLEFPLFRSSRFPVIQIKKGAFVGQLIHLLNEIWYKFYTSTSSVKALVYICRCNNNCSNADRSHGSGPQRRSLETWVEKSQCHSQRNRQNDLKAYIYFCQSTGLIIFVCLNKPPLWEVLLPEMPVCPKLQSRHCWVVSWDKHPKAV